MPPAEINRERKRGRRWGRKRTAGASCRWIKSRSDGGDDRGIPCVTFHYVREVWGQFTPGKKAVPLPRPSSLVHSCPSGYSGICCSFHFLRPLSPHRASPRIPNFNSWSSFLLYVTYLIYISHLRCVFFSHLLLISKKKRLSSDLIDKSLFQFRFLKAN